MTRETDRRLAWRTAEEVVALANESTLVVQPIGSVEQHGPHLPCITDTVIAQTVTEQAIDRLPAGVEVWMLPPLAYGKSNEHIGRAGTISLSAETLIAVCRDVGRSVAASGLRRLAFVNGHGGQPGLLDMVSRDIRAETGLLVFHASLGRLGLPAGLMLSDADFGIHAGELETAVMLAIDDQLVRRERMKADGLAARSLFADCEHLTLEGAVTTAWLTDDLSPSGVIGDPRAATAEQGKRVVDHWAEQLAGALSEMSAFQFSTGSR
jgi:creatinine amidohydrolase/Fe(II)-dependent formamide hydrolase-like protein